LIFPFFFYTCIHVLDSVAGPRALIYPYTIIIITITTNPTFYPKAFFCYLKCLSSASTILRGVRGGSTTHSQTIAPLASKLNSVWELKFNLTKLRFNAQTEILKPVACEKAGIKVYASFPEETQQGSFSTIRIRSFPPSKQLSLPHLRKSFPLFVQRLAPCSKAYQPSPLALPSYLE